MHKVIAADPLLQVICVLDVIDECTDQDLPELIHLVADTL